MQALILACVVVGVVDGDTLRVRCPGAEQQTIRLAQIDAPERAQPWGERSKQTLATLCHGQRAAVRPQAEDRFGRTVASVACAGTDASEQQVRVGMAWAYTKYLTDRSLEQLERDARAAKLGLWVDAWPVPPWEWRAAQRTGEELGRPQRRQR